MIYTHSKRESILRLALLLAIGFLLVLFTYCCFDKVGDETRLRLLMRKLGWMRESDLSVYSAASEGGSYLSYRAKERTIEPSLPDAPITTSQLDLACAVFELGPNPEFVIDKVLHMPLSQRNIRELCTKKRQYLRFDLATGELISFYDLELEEVPENVTKNDAIPKEKAVEAANSLLQDLRRQAGFEIKSVVFEDSPVYASPGSGGRLEGALWVIKGVLEYDGIRYLGAGTEIEVSAYSGRIRAYSCRPLGPLPLSMEERVGSTQAMQIGTEFLHERYGHDLTAEEFLEPEKCIARQNNCWTRGRGEPLTQGDAAYLCWVVRVKPKGNEESAPVVFVDASSGKICGGAD